MTRLHTLAATFAVSLLLASGSSFALGAKPEKAPTPQEQPGGKAVKPLPDRVLGQKEAPVEVIEYASLTCPHCAEFHSKVLPGIKEEYIKTGKVRYVYRDFPIDGMALRGAQLARCLPEKRYYGFLDTLYSRQASWVNREGDTAELEQMAALAGLGKDAAEDCLKDEALQKGLLLQRLHASNVLRVDATPSLFINGERVEGSLAMDDLREKLDAAVKQAR